MKNAPSKTAIRVALRRAAHQVLDDPRVFVDPLALAIVGADAASIERDPGNHSSFGRSLRAFMAARSRWTEDRLAAAAGGGVTQYVVLGAGFDTFGLRNPFPQLKVFEVDHPATQELKRERVKAAGLSDSGQPVYVSTDFETQTFAGALTDAGFDLTRPAFISWLGVVPYLAQAAIDSTLRFVASLEPTSEVVFDYAVDPRLLSLTERLAVRALAERVAAAGESFRTYFRPAELHEDLRSCGFDTIDELESAHINKLYFNDRHDGLKLRGGAGRLISARRTDKVGSRHDAR